jgi:oligopeptide transport system substrate-binding protein
MKKRQILALALGGTLVVPLISGCNSNPGIASSSQAASDYSTSGSTDVEGKTYTLREYDSSTPTNWCPVSWEMSNDTYIPGYCEMGFVDLAKKADSTDYEFVYEMASDIKDVTADYLKDTAFTTKWGLASDATEQVYEIDLNKAAKFQDGTAINADTYVDCMKEMLDPKMKNYRATTYYTGDVAIKGGYSYFLSDSDNYHALGTVDDLVKAGSTRVDQKTYLNWMSSVMMTDSTDWFGGASFADITTGGGYASYFSYKDASGNTVNVPAEFPNATEMTDTIRAELKKMKVCTSYLAETDGSVLDSTIDTYFGSALLHDPALSWDAVGLLKKDDSTLLYITENPVSPFYFKTNMTTNWIFDKTIFDSLKNTTGTLVTTSYGTSFDSYKAYGPYKLTSFEKDKQIKFERNTNWYGWTDGKHNGQYQATNIVMDVIPSHETALLAFQKGELDTITLEQADMSKYGYSDYILHTPETYTKRLVFDSNVEDLTKLETAAGDGNNKKILAEKDFRKALSLSIDRKKFCNEATSGHEPAFGLLNNLYYYDVENDPTSIYRNTDEAKKAIVDLYGLEYGTGKTYADLNAAYKAVTGLDVTAAKALFTSAYTAAIADGNYTDGQSIKLNIGLSDKTLAPSIAEIKVLNENVAAATAGTPLEGKITFEGKSYNGDTTRYDAINGGAIEISDCAWGGAAFWPFSGFDVYTGANGYKYNEVRSWDPKNTSLTLNYDFDSNGTAEDMTKTYYDWEASLTDAKTFGSATTPMATRLFILSRLENGLLDQYNFAVVSSYGSASLFSKKINYGTTTYNVMYGYGGIRWTSFNYDDAGWTAYVKAQGGTIDYA